MSKVFRFLVIVIISFFIGLFVIDSCKNKNQSTTTVTETKYLPGKTVIVRDTIFITKKDGFVVNIKRPVPNPNNPSKPDTQRVYTQNINDSLLQFKQTLYVTGVLDSSLTNYSVVSKTKTRVDTLIKEIKTTTTNTVFKPPEHSVFIGSQFNTVAGIGIAATYQRRNVSYQYLYQLNNQSHSIGVNIRLWSKP